MIQEELKERILISIIISPIIILIALPTLNIPIYISFVYIFFISLALVLLFEVIRMFESKHFYIPKIKKLIFITFTTLSIITLSSLSLTGKISENTQLQFSTFSDISSVFIIFSTLIIITLLINLTISSLNISKHNYLQADSIFFTISLYISIGISSMLILKLIDIDKKTFFLSFSLGVGWFSEAGGLIVGKLIGKTKLSFLASPNKTLEGSIAMIIFGIIGGIIFKSILTLFEYQNTFFISSYTETLVLSIIVTVFCFIGDIIESLVKRLFEAKDSSNVLLSLGGLFDVFDGVMFASFGVMLYYFLV